MVIIVIGLCLVFITSSSHSLMYPELMVMVEKEKGDGKVGVEQRISPQSPFTPMGKPCVTFFCLLCVVDVQGAGKCGGNCLYLFCWKQLE